MKARFKRLFRGIVFFLKSILIEKPKGLDFSMRQKRKGIKTKGNHGYALTQEKAFDGIMSYLNITEEDSFIDIGCGKGGCLLYAYKNGFGRIAGIEIEKCLYDIADKNFQRLGLRTKIELYNEDAVSFGKYSEFNVFYLFNPFDTDIYKKVIDSIIEQTEDYTKERPMYLVCYGASARDYIKSKGKFVMEKDYTDNVRGTSVCIWRRVWENTV